MQRLSGVLMVLAGVGLGGYTLLPASTDTAETLAEVTRISTSSDANVGAASASAKTNPNKTEAGIGSTSPTSVRVFSPSAPLLPPNPDEAPAATGKWTAVVTTERENDAHLTSAKPGDAEARAHLASDLQRELKRVGCYGGEINGAWTQTTKRAMSAFMDRVNASLPVEEPDYILLTLVQGHAAVACGTGCPQGEIQSYSGRCLPHAVVAQASRKLQREEERREQRRIAEMRKSQQQELLAGEQRASEAKRVADAQRTRRDQDIRDQAQRLAAAVTARADALKLERDPPAKPQKSAAMSPEKLPWLDEAGRSATHPRRVQPAVRAEPLPGMMSVGGPTTASAELPLDAGPVDAGIVTTERSQQIDLATDRPDADDLRSGLAGSKSGVAVTAHYPNEFATGPNLRKYPAAKIARRPPPGYYGSKSYGSKYNKRKAKYAYNSGGKVRRGQPRMGTARYNLLQSLGGIY